MIQVISKKENLVVDQDINFLIYWSVIGGITGFDPNSLIIRLDINKLEAKYIIHTVCTI